MATIDVIDNSPGITVTNASAVDLSQPSDRGMCSLQPVYDAQCLVDFDIAGEVKEIKVSQVYTSLSDCLICLSRGGKNKHLMQCRETAKSKSVTNVGVRKRINNGSVQLSFEVCIAQTTGAKLHTIEVKVRKSLSPFRLKFIPRDEHLTLQISG